jgi:hypothetical protein
MWSLNKFFAELTLPDLIPPPTICGRLRHLK